MDALFYIARIFKTGFVNFFRNGWLSVAATTVMVLTLFTISVFTILNFGINAATASIQQKIDVTAYLNDGVAPTVVNKLIDELKNQSNVKSVIYISKSDAVKAYRAQNKGNAGIAGISDDDLAAALPASIQVLTKDPNHLSDVKRILGKSTYAPAIHNSNYQGEKEQTINRLVRITNFIKTAGLALSVIFIATSLLVIFNTVRIAIFTRREEIEIMKLVGATSNFIRWPFIIEGATYGTIATVISFLIQYLAISYGAPQISNYLKISDVGGIFDYFNQHLVLVIGTQLLIGILIGTISSYIAIRRYLKIAHHI